MHFPGERKALASLRPQLADTEAFTRHMSRDTQLHKDSLQGLTSEQGVSKAIAVFNNSILNSQARFERSTNRSTPQPSSQQASKTFTLMVLTGNNKFVLETVGRHQVGGRAVDESKAPLARSTYRSAPQPLLPQVPRNSQSMVLTGNNKFVLERVGNKAGGRAGDESNAPLARSTHRSAPQPSSQQTSKTFTSMVLTGNDKFVLERVGSHQAGDCAGDIPDAPLGDSCEAFLADHEVE